MNSLVVAVLAFVGYIIAYKTYGRFLSKKIFNLDDSNIVPSHAQRDDIDFVPTQKSVLFGHHFSSIAGAGPIVGPAIAVIWGWLPAMIWVVLGSILIGGVHDMGSLVISMRNKGKSIGQIAQSVINPTVWILFLAILLTLLVLVIAVFILIISLLFKMYPASVFPIWFQVPLALLFGYIVNKRGGNVYVWGIFAIYLMYLSIFYSVNTPVLANFHIPPLLGSEILSWNIILLIYCFFASVLPVQILLQPRDFINAQQLFVTLGLLFGGLIIVHPQITAPAINSGVSDAPSIIPFLFITVACGAVSGFHTVVASGTTVKQIDKETDALPIGYGSMLAEGALAVIVILACTAGLGGRAAWSQYYASWSAVSGLGAKLNAFIVGGSSFMEGLGLKNEISSAIIAVMIVCFAATTLDTSTRLLRYIISELAESISFTPLTNRYTSTGLGLFLALALAVLPPLLTTGKIDGSGGMLLWPLFGTGNQLLGGLAFLVLTVWMKRLHKPIRYTLIPLIFLLGMTGWAMLENLKIFYQSAQFHLLFIGGIVLIFEVIMVYQAVIVYRTIND